MGNLCTGSGAVESRRKQQRAGSDSTTGFSPTEDLGHVRDGPVAPGGSTSGSAMPAHSRGQAAGEGAGVSAPEMGVGKHHQAHQKRYQEQDSREGNGDINAKPSTGNNERGSQREVRHRRHPSRGRDAPGEEGTHQEGTSDAHVGRNAGPGATGSADDGESGEGRSEKGDIATQKRRDRPKDGEPRPTRRGGHRHPKSRPSGGSAKDDSKGAGGQPRSRERRKDADIQKNGDLRSSSSRPRRGSDRDIHGEPGTSRGNDRPDGNTDEPKSKKPSKGGEPESDEARRQRRQRKRKAKAAAAVAAAGTTPAAGGGLSVDDAPVGEGRHRNSASNATSDPFQDNGEGKAHERSRRKEAVRSTSETRADGDAGEAAVGDAGEAPPYTDVVKGVYGAAPDENGSGTAVAAVVAAPVVVAKAMVVSGRKGKNDSALKKVNLVVQRPLLL